MMTNEARVAAVMERVRARVQLRKQRRMAGVLVLAALAAGIVLGSMAHHALAAGIVLGSMAHHGKEVD